MSAGSDVRKTFSIGLVAEWYCAGLQTKSLLKGFKSWLGSEKLIKLEIEQ